MGELLSLDQRLILACEDFEHLVTLLSSLEEEALKVLG
jgi:hypothetical protein